MFAVVYQIKILLIGLALRGWKGENFRAEISLHKSWRKERPLGISRQRTKQIVGETVGVYIGWYRYRVGSVLVYCKFLRGSRARSPITVGNFYQTIRHDRVTKWKLRFHRTGYLLSSYFTTGQQSVIKNNSSDDLARDNEIC